MSFPRLRVLAIVADGSDDHAIRTALPPATPLQVVQVSEAHERGAALVEETGAELVLLSCSAYSEPVLRVIESISAYGRCPVVVLYSGTPNGSGFLEAAFAAGADDLITLPLPPEHVAFAIEKVIARRRGLGSSALAPMITILGPKGGTGKTLTACNLTAALALTGSRAVVVDLDLQFGDVGLALGLKPTRTLYDLAVAGGSLDAEKVDSYVLEHPTGARALLAPVRPDQAVAIGTSFLRTVFEVLRSRYDFVIADTPPAFTPEVIAAIDAASDLCVVGMLDALSLKDTKIGFETLAQMGLEPAEATLVLNRADTSVGISQADVTRLLGQRPDVLVPSNREIPRALTEGRTIVEAAPKSGPARAFMALADRYLKGQDGAAPAVPVNSERRRGRGEILALPARGS